MKNLFRPLNFEEGRFEPTPETLAQIHAQFGVLNLPRDTTNDLKLYDLNPLIQDHSVLEDFYKKFEATVRLFSYDKDPQKKIPQVIPRFDQENYGTGIVWIYNPAVLAGSFRDEKYTEAWRKIHELGHCIAEPFLLSRYGESFREGRLGQFRKVYWKKDLVNPVSVRQAQRGIEWEHLAFRTQRMLSTDLNITISDENYQKEYNVNMADAILRVVTGDFGNPGKAGFYPHGEEMDLQSILLAMEDAANQINPMTPEVRSLVLGDIPDLTQWYDIGDDVIREAIEACAQGGIAAVHKNWKSFGFYKVPRL